MPLRMSSQPNSESVSPFKRGLLVLGLLFIMHGQAVSATEQERSLKLRTESPIIVEKGSVSVSEAELDGYLATRVPANDIPRLLSSSDRLGRILENLIRTNGFFELALSEELLESPRNQARLLYAVARQSEAIYREHYLAEIELESYEDRARELYLTRPDDFRRSASINFDHLLLTVDSERSETEAMLLIVELHEKLSSGSDFRSLAEQYSDDPTIDENAGSYTDIDTSMLVPSLANALQDLSPGEWTDPVRTQFGWHLARLNTRNESAVMDWEEARPAAIQAAREEHFADAMERQIRDLFDAPAVFTEGAVERIFQRYDVPVDGVINNPELGDIELQ